MPLKKHHKWMIGGFSTLLIIIILTSSFLTYTLYLQQKQQYESLSDEITQLRTNTQSQISELSGSIFEIKTEINESQQTQQELQEQFQLLKASAGEDFSGIIERVIPSIVTIRTTSAQGTGFIGTGFIIDEDGYIVTNAHVLANELGQLSSNIEIITYSQNVVNAEFIGYNGLLDLALLKISGTYEGLEFGNSDDVEVGQKVIAIGNPLGLQFSVSEGIVSAIHRTGSNGFDAYIQTDTALNPGNSGGPLLDKTGNVIGINNFKISGGENLGFALESNYIKETINDISQETLNYTLIQ